MIGHSIRRKPVAGVRSSLTAAAAILLATGCAAGPLRPNGQVTLATPPSAPADPVRLLALATVRGPAAPATTAAATASCPAGSALSGGGVATTLIGGRTPPSSLHVNGTSPAGSGWTGVGATGGQIVLGGVTTAVAVCLRRAPGLGPPTIVVAAAPGPAQAATTTRVTASCPPGRMLLGGGGRAAVTQGSASPSLHLIGTYPSDAQGAPATAPTSWSAVADAGGRTGSGVQTVAFAVCATPGPRRASVVLARRPGPLPAGTATTATATCPSRTLLISGGALTGPASGTPQQGLHLTGSFPSSAGGTVAGSAPGAVDGNAWTARAESGGQGSPAGTVTTAFAVCLRP